MWHLRGGEGHRLVPKMIEEGWIGVGFESIPEGSRVDLARATKYVTAEGRSDHPEASAQMFCTFVRGLSEGDLVVLPDPGMRGVAVGWVTGPYRYEADVEGRAFRHRRSVDWVVRIPERSLPDRVASIAKIRHTLRKIDDGAVRATLKRFLDEGGGEDPRDRRGATSARAASGTVRSSRPRSAAPARPPAPTIATRTCQSCMTTKRAELFDGDSAYCVDCS